ncbi:MAG TPA: APC family permease [Myxococcota bacterium]
MTSTRLSRVLGAGVGLAVGVGTTIGSGILRAPADVAAQLPDRAWIAGVWIAGGLYALLGANAMAEVATLVGRSGGFYPIARRGLGTYAGFVVGWLDFINGCGSLASVALLVADNAVVVSPDLDGWNASIAAFGLVALAALQWRGVALGAKAQIALSALKAIAFIALVIGCFVNAATHDDVTAPIASAVAPVMPHGVGLIVAVAIALQGVIYTYDGWYSAIYLGEELKDPGKEIPRSLFSTVGAVAVLQLLVNFAFLAVLPLGVLALSTAPAAAAAGVVLGSGADKAIAGLVVLSLAGAVSATLLGTPRVLYAMARDRLVPNRLAGTTDQGTPAIAVALTILGALAIIKYAKTFEAVAASLSVLMVGTYASFFLALFALRAREPNTERPFRARGYPWLPGLGLLLSAAFIGTTAYGDPKAAAAGGVILVVSVPAFILQRFISRRSPSADSGAGA